MAKKLTPPGGGAVPIGRGGTGSTGGNSSSVLGGKGRPISTTGSLKPGIGSKIRNAKTQITNPSSPNTRTGNAARTLKAAKAYQGAKAPGTNPLRRAKATVNTYKVAKKDPTGMGAQLKRNPPSRNSGM